MSDHTRGPWKIGDVVTHTEHGINNRWDWKELPIHDQYGRTVAVIRDTPLEANAALISAAPDLLAIVQELYDDLADEVALLPQYRKLYDAARAALQKAQPHKWDEVES